MKIMLVDCGTFCHVAKYRLYKYLSALKQQEKQKEVVFQFLQQLCDTASLIKPDKVIFAWDSSHSFRKEIEPTYKGNRAVSEMTPEKAELEELSPPQFKEIRMKTLPALGFESIHVQRGCEADDVLAQFVVNDSKEQKHEWVIVSNDEDMFQLLRIGVTIYNPTKRQEFTFDWFRETYQIYPHQWTVVKAIGGCKSDNVEGIYRIGEKKMCEYISGKMNPESNSHKKIRNKYSELMKKNIPLVKLPFKQTNSIPIGEQELLLTEKFRKVFKHYGFGSQSAHKRFKEWTNAFNLI